jgi:hypothetical protein
MKMEKKKNYEQPYMTSMAVENELMTTFSGDHNPGSNGGKVGDAKSSNFYFEEDDESDEE